MSHIDSLQGCRRDDQWSKCLVKVALDRDELAFEELFNHFAPLLKGFFATTPPAIKESELEELVQEIMCKVWLKAQSFDPTKSAASTWVYTVARNSRIDYIRKNAKQDQLTSPLEVDDIWDEASDNQPYSLLSQSRNEASVKSLLKVLPPEQSQCLVKMYMEGKSHAQLSSELELPLGTVKSRIRLGLKRLQNWAAGEGKDL